MLFAIYVEIRSSTVLFSLTRMLFVCSCRRCLFPKRKMELVKLPVWMRPGRRNQMRFICQKLITNHLSVKVTMDSVFTILIYNHLSLLIQSPAALLPLSCKFTNFFLLTLERRCKIYRYMQLNMTTLIFSLTLHNRSLVIIISVFYTCNGKNVSFICRRVS